MSVLVGLFSGSFCSLQVLQCLCLGDIQLPEETGSLVEGAGVMRGMQAFPAIPSFSARGARYT